MWSIINEQRGKMNSCSTDFTDAITKSDGSPFMTKKEVVDNMNARFAGAAAACGAPQARPACVQSALNTVRPPADRSLRLRPFTADEVFCIISKRIPSKPSKDAYGISMKFLALAAVPLSPVLADLYNLYLKNGLYPSPLKLSKVSPLYKNKGKKQDMDSYRPVSIIPAVAKVFENGLSTRLIQYLSSVNALSDRQYAYREGRSTTCLTREVVSRVLGAREKKLHVAVLCCDLSKAFDLADHTILEIKMRHYGIQNMALGVLRAMLYGRFQIVVGGAGAERSDPLPLTMGVPQGSSVSNVLFSLLLNDLPDAISNAEILMYADDVAAVVTATSVDHLEEKLNDVARQLIKWFQNNGLVLNLSKTHYMHFRIGGRDPRPMHVFVDGGIRMEQRECTTFLGFEVDKALTWVPHIHKMCGRLGSACFALNRMARFLPDDVVRTCYFATVHSILQYGAELWSRSADWLRVFRMQKRAVRALARIPQDCSVRPHFKRLNILTLPSILIYKAAIYVRLNLKSFRKLGDTHSYNTRRANKLATMPRRLSKSSNLINVVGPTVYNRLPDTITAAISHAVFKQKLKSWLIEQAFYSYEEFVSAKLT